MTIWVPVFAATFALPTMMLRRKQYEMSYLWMFLILGVYIILGVLGAIFGSVIAYGLFSGIRLYGLMIFEIASVFLTARWKKITPEKAGDYMATPLICACMGAKILCLVHGCCDGFVLYEREMQPPIRFPSVIMEMTMWAAVAVALLVFEKKKTVTGLLYPIMVIWFGILRYIADFFRGSQMEQSPYLLWIPAGRFWSLVVAAMGFVLLYFWLKKQLARKPTVREMLRVCIGKSPVAVQ